MELPIPLQPKLLLEARISSDAPFDLKGASLGDGDLPTKVKQGAHVMMLVAVDCTVLNETYSALLFVAGF